MFNQADIIKHESSMDVAFEVTNILLTKTSIFLKGRWVNQAFVKSYIIDSEIITIEILNEDVDKWLVCTNPNEHLCLRKCTWRAMGKIECAPN